MIRNSKLLSFHEFTRDWKHLYKIHFNQSCWFTNLSLRPPRRCFLFFFTFNPKSVVPAQVHENLFSWRKTASSWPKNTSEAGGVGGGGTGRGDVWPVKGIRSPPLAGAETLLCLLACLTYFLRPDKLQRHEARLYVFGLGYIPERAEWTLGGREDRPVVGGQVVCPRRHTLLKGQAPRSGWFGLAALDI